VHCQLLRLKLFEPINLKLLDPLFSYLVSDYIFNFV